MIYQRVFLLAILLGVPHKVRAGGACSSEAAVERVDQEKRRVDAVATVMAQPNNTLTHQVLQDAGVRHLLTRTPTDRLANIARGVPGLVPMRHHRELSKIALAAAHIVSARRGSLTSQPMADTSTERRTQEAITAEPSVRSSGTTLSGRSAHVVTLLPMVPAQNSFSARPAISVERRSL